MPVTKEGTSVCIENEWIRRVVDTDGGVRTTESLIRPRGSFGQERWKPLHHPKRFLPLEASVTVEGVEYQAASWTPEPGFSRGGVYDVAYTEIKRTSLGEVVVIRCIPRHDRIPRVALDLRYEIAGKLPLLVKQVVVQNLGDTPVVVDNITVEMAPRIRLDREYFIFTDYYESYESVRFPDDYYRSCRRFRFPEPVRMRLSPGETMESFRCFEYAASGPGTDASVTRSRIFMELAPWLKKPLVQQSIGTASTREELEALPAVSAKAGIELATLFIDQIFTNIGDYVPRPDLFPDGEDGIRRVIDAFHKQNVRVVPYVGLTIAWQKNEHVEDSQVVRDHPDWQYLGPDGIRFNAWGQGNMCFQSGWGEYITDICERLLEWGFDGLHFDGPYHWLPCLEEGHAHDGPNSVRYMNWRWEKRFFHGLAARGCYVSAPQDDASLLFGNQYVPAGYTEQDLAMMGGMDLVSTHRALVHDRRIALPGCCCLDFVALDERHGHSIEESEDDPSSYAHALGGCFGYGHPGPISARTPWVGAKTRDVYQKWIDFYIARRETMTGQFVSLVRPDGVRPDAAMIVNRDAEPPAVVIAFNPSREPAVLELRLPLEYAGFGAKSTVVVDGEAGVPLDSNAAARLRIELAPREVRTMDIGCGTS